MPAAREPHRCRGATTSSRARSVKKGTRDGVERPAMDKKPHRADGRRRSTPHLAGPPTLPKLNGETAPTAHSAQRAFEKPWLA
jgi:hypothetical protein